MASLIVLILVAMAGLAIINLLLSFVSRESCKVLQKTPEIDRGIFTELRKAKDRSTKYTWAGPQVFSQLAVRALWVIYLVGLALVVTGLYSTDMVQKGLFAFGICTALFSVVANLTISLFAWLVMGRMAKEKEKLENPIEEDVKKKKRKTIRFFGISIEI